MENKYLETKRHLLVQVQQELSSRSKAWETLCSLPEFKAYAELRASLERHYKKLDQQKAELDVLQRQYDRVPEIEGNIVSLWFKLLKTKIKYRRNKKYKAVLRIEQAKYDYETKKLKRKLFYGKLYEVKNQYELTKTAIKSIQTDNRYAYFENMRQDIKAGKDFDKMDLNIAIYAQRPFDVRQYSYKGLTECKAYLQTMIKSDEKFM